MERRLRGGTVIAGSTKIGKYCIIYGAAVINGHIQVCDQVTITGMSMVMRSISEPGVYSSGVPAQSNKEWRKMAVRVMHIDDMHATAEPAGKTGRRPRTISDKDTGLSNELNQLDIQEILELLPHRYPFLLVDRAVNYEIGEGRKVLRAIKNVSFNEPFFQGHFPQKPVLPGVLILEAMAQATLGFWPSAW